MKHQSNLDILRALAVICVLIHHLALTLHQYTGFLPADALHYPVALGHAGVLAFFVHTSLVLMHSLERLRSVGGRVTRAFYIRRAFRIYPLAIFAILIALLFHFPSKTWDTPDPVTPPIIAANLLLIQNIFTKKEILGPLWSLPYEVQMYLVLPALYLITRLRKAPAYLFALYLAFSALGVLIFTRTGHLNMAAYVPCFISGVISYALRNRVRAVLPAALWIPSLLTLIALFASYTQTGEEPPYWSGWIFCLLLGLMIDLFRDSTLRPINFAADRVAVYSYGIYLLHMPALAIVFQRFGIHHLIAAPLLTLLLTATAAVPAYHLIELPCMNLGKRLSTPQLRHKVRETATIAPAPGSVLSSFHGHPPQRLPTLHQRSIRLVHRHSPH